jgi:hypothetical protein
MNLCHNDNFLLTILLYACNLCTASRRKANVASEYTSLMAAARDIENAIVQLDEGEGETPSPAWFMLVNTQQHLLTWANEVLRGPLQAEKETPNYVAKKLNVTSLAGGRIQ